MYTMYMKHYTVAELRIQTRKILNEALTEPITITRYDETFIITSGNQKIESESENMGGVIKIDPKKLKQDMPLKIDVGKTIPVTAAKVAERGTCKNGHILNRLGKCEAKGCK